MQRLVCGECPPPLWCQGPVRGVGGRAVLSPPPGEGCQEIWRNPGWADGRAPRGPAIRQAGPRRPLHPGAVMSPAASRRPVEYPPPATGKSLPPSGPRWRRAPAPPLPGGRAPLLVPVSGVWPGGRQPPVSGSCTERPARCSSRLAATGPWPVPTTMLRCFGGRLISGKSALLLEALGSCHPQTSPGIEKD
jgi:hypothetical protein